MYRRWSKIEKDFYTKSKTFDISKIPDIYDCIKYDLQHNQHTIQFEQAEELYINAKYLADIVIPQVSWYFIFQIVPCIKWSGIILSVNWNILSIAE